MRHAASELQFPPDYPVISGWYTPSDLAISAGVEIVFISRSTPGAPTGGLAPFWANAVFDCLECAYRDSEYEGLTELACVDPANAQEFLELYRSIGTLMGPENLRLQAPSLVLRVSASDAYVAFLGLDPLGPFFYLAMSSGPDCPIDLKRLRPKPSAPIELPTSQ